MDVLFIRAHKRKRHSHPENVRAPLDVGYTASLLESKGHKTHFIDMKVRFHNLKMIKSKTDRLKPDLVLIKSQTPSFNLTLKLARKLKDSSQRLRLGVFGQHATVMPDSFLFDDSPVDYCLLGEPEAVVGRLVGAIDGNGDVSQIPGLALWQGGQVQRQGTRQLVTDVDNLPRPKHEWFLDGCYRDYLPISVRGKKKYGYILSSRGCPYSCIYCSPTLRVSYGDNFRTRSAAGVVDEMEFLREQGVNVIVFKDDLLTFSKQHVLDICHEIRRRDLQVKWFAQTRADALDSELMRSMKLAGCETVGIGVESGSTRILKLLNKEETKEDIRRGFEIARRQGMKTVGFFMLGNPTERGEEMMATLKFCKELRPNMIQVAFFTPYPGSQAYEEFLTDSDISFTDYSHYNHLTYNPSQVSDTTLQNFQKQFYRSYITSPPFILSFFKQKLRSLLFNFNRDTNFLKKAIKFLYDV